MTTRQRFDAIVLGLGGMGAAALCSLARRGRRALGLEQFSLGHALGSSHGQTRLIRKAYFEHPDYVPLLERAYVLWRELEDATGQHLFEDGLGLVVAGPGDRGVLPATLACARKHSLPIHPVSLADRWPMLRLPEGMESIYDAEGGLLYVDRCVLAHLDEARRRGATVCHHEAVRGWTQVGGTVRVETEADTYEADRLLVTAGAWSARLLQDLGLPLRIVRKLVFWYPEREPGTYALGCCPTFFYDLPWGRIYGFPSVDGESVKLADHSGGRTLDAPRPGRSLQPGDEDTCRRAVRELLPGLIEERMRYSVCMYTMTPDENFIVDRHPEHDAVVFAAGFSGHGFKFAPVVGEALADLALEGRTRHPIAFLRVDRPGLTEGPELPDPRAHRGRS